MPPDSRPRVSLREVEGTADVARLAARVGEERDAARRRAWTIVAEGAEVGVVVASRTPDRVEARIFVAPAFRRRGIARQALGRVIGARPFDAEMLTATTRQSDVAGAALLAGPGSRRSARAVDW